MTGEASWLTLLGLVPFFGMLGIYWFLTRRSVRHAHH